MYNLTISRANGKKTSQEKINKQIDYLIKRSLASSRGRSWEVKTKTLPTYQQDDLWVFSAELTFEKTKGHKSGEAENNQFEQIKAMLAQSGQSAKFGPYPWKILGDEDIALIPTQTIAQPKKAIAHVMGVQDVHNPIGVKSWGNLHIPPELFTSDDAIAQHPCFQNIYGLEPQIRTILSGIQSAVETNGNRRFHFVLHGPPACAKTTTLLAIEKLLGEGSVLRLDATSTTRAGLERLFFQDLPEVPPLVFMEEAEKCNEDFLKIWLGALDDRGEIRKVNFRMCQTRQIKILFFCTVNNKGAFDALMNDKAGGKQPGALSSRCVNDIYFPRPSEKILTQILVREIKNNGGKEEWIDPCLKLAKELQTDDPRKVLSFLAGQDRLLSGEYQKDRMAIKSNEK
jgi:hypothetical protein